MDVEFSSNAREELFYGIEYYEQRQKGLGLAFSSQIFEAIDRIAEMPHSWTPLDDTFQRCLVKQFPFALIFTLQEKRCIIVAIMNLHREPDYWREP